MKLSATLAAAAIAILTGAVTCRLSAGEPKEVEDGFREMLRVVEDKDGTTNVRAGASGDAKVVGKAVSGAVVAAFGSEGAWTSVDVGGVNTGDRFIHSSRLKPLTGWKQVSADKGGSPDKGSVSHAGAEVVVTESPFVAANHKITKDGNGAHLVDGRHPWGTDGELPKRSLALTVKLAGKPVSIPAEAVRDLYEPAMDSLVILTPGKPSSQMVVAMWNSDGAGGYLVAWSFVNGSYAGRTVAAP